MHASRSATSDTKVMMKDLIGKAAQIEMEDENEEFAWMLDAVSNMLKMKDESAMEEYLLGILGSHSLDKNKFENCILFSIAKLNKVDSAFQFGFMKLKEIQL